MQSDSRFGATHVQNGQPALNHLPVIRALYLSATVLRLGSSAGDAVGPRLCQSWDVHLIKSMQRRLVRGPWITTGEIVMGVDHGQAAFLLGLCRAVAVSALHRAWRLGVRTW